MDLKTILSLEWRPARSRAPVVFGRNLFPRTGSDEVIAYCRIGERSSHTWFVLKYLLGYNDVKDHDGS
jgi:rhodanese-related sulfurtransferase